MNNIELKVTEIVNKCKADAKKIEDFAKELDFSVFVKPESNISQAIYKKFPELHFSNSSLNMYNIDDIVGNIKRAVTLLMPNAFNKIRFDSYNLKKKTIKLTSYESYDIFWFCKYFGFNESDFKEKVVKEYQNGSIVVELSEDDFNKFVKLANFTTDETKQIIEAITPEDKMNYLETIKRSSGNPYYVVHQIRERLNIKSNLLPVNYRLVFDALKM